MVAPEYSDLGHKIRVFPQSFSRSYFGVPPLSKNCPDDSISECLFVMEAIRENRIGVKSGKSRHYPIASKCQDLPVF
jgi:hypothetical protein